MKPGPGAWASSSRSDLAALGGLVALVLFLFRRAVFGGEAIFERDIGFWYYPQVESMVRVITSGALPLWDPYMSFGVPLLGNPSTQALYPVTLLHLLFEPWTFYTLYVVGHLVFTGAGQYILARRLGLSALGSFVAAAAWIASGPLLSFANMWHHFSGATWIPWVFLAAERACDTLKPRDALFFGVVMSGQILAGSADMCAIAMLPAMVCVSRRLVWSRPAGAQNRRWLGAVGVAWLLALGLTAPQWLTSLELLPNSWRWGLGQDVRTFWSVHPWQLLQLVVPIGTLGLRITTPDDRLTAELGSPLLYSLYLGVPVLGLAAAALCGPARPLRRFFAVLLLATILVALGRHSIFYQALVTVFPPLKIVRYPMKVMALVPFACGLLAGMGIDAWRRAYEMPSRMVLATGAWIAVLGSLCAAVSRLAGRGADYGSLLPLADPKAAAGLLAELASRAFLAAAAGLAMLVLLALRSRSRAAWIAPAAAVLAVAELALANRHLNPTIPSALLAERPATVDALARDGAQALTRLYVWDYSLSVQGKKFPTKVVNAFNNVEWDGSQVVGRAVAMRMYCLPSGRWGLHGSFDRDILGLSPSYLQNLVLAFRATEETPAFTRLLEMGSVNYLLALHREGLEDLAETATIPSPFLLPIRILRVPNPLPRVYAVGRARVIAGGKVLAPLVDEGFDPRQEVLLAEGAPLQSSRFAGSVRILDLRPDRVRVEAVLDQPGYVVMTDTYDPGWKATVDGQRVAVERANIAFRAVRVPAGRHVVEQYYRPRGFVVGFWLAATSAAAALVSLARARGSLRTRPSAPVQTL